MTEILQIISEHLEEKFPQHYKAKCSMTGSDIYISHREGYTMIYVKDADVVINNYSMYSDNCRERNLIPLANPHFLEQITKMCYHHIVK